MGYLYRAIDQFGQVIDVLVSQKRDMAATRRFFTRALEHGPCPTEGITDKAAVSPPVLDEVARGAWHHTEPYASNGIESDHGRVKPRLRPMRGLKQLRCAQVISAGHAFIQNLRRGYYELGVEEPMTLRVPSPSWPWPSDQTTGTDPACRPFAQRNSARSYAFGDTTAEERTRHRAISCPPHRR